MSAKLHSQNLESAGQQTRKRLLNAAVECLIEFGVAGTTTLAVQHRAAVSRGALLHHFPSHAELLAATVTELVARNELAVGASRQKSQGIEDPLERVMQALAYAARQPAYLAELELWAVARTDPHLKRVLLTAERRARRDSDRVHEKLFREWSDSEAFQDVMALTQYFIRGLAISENLRSSAIRRDRLIAIWTKSARLMLERNDSHGRYGETSAPR
ncbi:TetR family transcriptional regulator [Afipia sp. P52-10]|uniref:TetR/AcrR family transcriptional regulator n=1 Tax=Afipia sp. P52-10 TaxID=1429916 RepID=UPI0003DF106B|nr:TetR family transcriptional regulator [Afipia sp. P52-10]ETR78708.1 TetR family transcriptional regulator [Afipia sp. P52-10]